MSESNQKTNEPKEGSQTKDKPIKDIINNLRDKQSTAISDMKDKIVDQVKKDIESAERLKQIEQENKELKDSIKSQREESLSEIEKIKNEFSKQLDDIKHMKIGVTDNSNPFSNPKGDENKTDLSELNDPAVVDEIEERSRKAFIEANNLPSDFGKAD